MAIQHSIKTASLTLWEQLSYNFHIGNIPYCKQKTSSVRIPYGYFINSNGCAAIEQEKTNTIRMIYQRYLSGMSLSGIADFLFEGGIPSPKGRERWTQPIKQAALQSKVYRLYRQFRRLLSGTGRDKQAEQSG